VRGDGDGWTRCAAGHRHWGVHGAAGLLLRDRNQDLDHDQDRRWDHRRGHDSDRDHGPDHGPDHDVDHGIDHDVDRVVLQHRAWWSHQGGTWGVPGCARLTSHVF